MSNSPESIRRNQPANNVEIPVPCCPYCHEEMPTVGAFNWQMGNYVILCVFCQNPQCRASLHFEVVPAAVPQEQSRIARPS